MFALLGGKLKAFGLFLIGFLLMLLALASRSIEKLKREKAEQEIEDMEVNQEVSRRANEAVIRGTANESAKEDRSNYKFGNHS